MSDDATGYRRPPTRSRFRKGVSGNPKGRPKRKAPAFGDIIDKVLNEPSRYREGGRTKTAPRWELAFWTHVKSALSGNLKSADAVLKIRAHAEKVGGSNVQKIEIVDWLPDYPGQTAEEKTRAARRGDTEPGES